MTGMDLAPLPANAITSDDLVIPSSAAIAAVAASAAVAPARPSRRSRRAGRTALAPGDRVGAWRIDAELGRGGMSAVYAVTHSRFGKRAALKLCSESILGDGFTAETFLREARIVHRVNHPGVCDVFATGTFRSRPYLVMERLAGDTLGVLHERGPLPREEVLDLLLEVCDVLAAAHAASVVHRDLKLDNIFVLETPGPGGRRAKLLDWGVARILGEEPDPLRGMVAGTLTYLAPEQIRGDEICPAADVYSLAVLAYQTLLGRAPFASKDDLALLRMHLRTAPPAPAELWPEIPAELAATLTAMLAKDAAQRPPIAEVRRVLALVRVGLVRPAPRPGLRRRVGGWLARVGRIVRIIPGLGRKPDDDERA
jgi:serine/threonine-protein kinase